MGSDTGDDASLERALEASPGDRALRLRLAEALLNDGRSADAIPHLEILLAMTPRSRDLQAMLGLAIGGAIVESFMAARPVDEQFDWEAAEAQLSDVFGTPAARADGTACAPSPTTTESEDLE